MEVYSCRPSTRLAFCIACTEAPFIRLSITVVRTASLSAHGRQRKLSQ